jgi:REP-associated tyrosine transposase
LIRYIHLNPVRANIVAEARAVTALIGMDDCDYLLSNLAQYFNRDMPSMSKRVKVIRARLANNRSMYEKMEHIKNQITTIRKA